MELPFLDITHPDFSTRSDEVLAARAASWCARTPFGLAVLRHRQAGQLLRDRRLRQGSHAWPKTVGLEGAFASFWLRSIISEEGPRHKLLRRVAMTALSEDFILSLAPRFTGMAEALMTGLEGQTDFPFVEAFSEPFAGQAVALALGQPMAEAGEIGRDASTLGLAMGIGAKRYETRVNAACDRLAARALGLIETARATPGGTDFVARLVAAAEGLGFKDTQALVDLVVISIFGGVDTTRAQLAFAMTLFADHPDQWTWLRSNPEAVPQAVEEIIRARPTTTWASRAALEGFTFEGVEIQAGEILHIFVHATGTDPASGHEGGFDIRRARKSHFGFGGGAHHCLGQFVARTDMAAALRVLLAQWTRVKVVGSPRFLPDSGNTSPVSLRIAPDWV
jgi:cytochrome P450